jgi:RNA polymerase sigma-70 factor (ECF subfamily)
MADSSQEFAELLARARVGDAEALNLLIQQYEGEIRLAVRVRLGPALRPHLDTLDIIQSVHGSLIRGLRNDKFELSNPKKLLALAIAIVRNKVAKHWRRYRRERPLPDQGSACDKVENILLSLAAPHDDPAEVAQFKDQIRKLYDSMSAQDRHVIQRRLEGYSTAEIARELGINPDFLRVRLSRLRQELKETGVLAACL